MGALETEIVEHLVAIRAQLDSMNEDALALVRRMDGVAERLAAISSCAERIDNRLDRIDCQLDRIETKLH